MKTALALIAAALLAACETFTGPKTAPCHWYYTKYELRTDTVTGGGILVPTDSTLRCAHHDQG